jgi:hypothetical protein
MRSSFLQLGLGALLALGSLGCNDYLRGTGLSGDPNNPSPADATMDELFVAAQASLGGQLTGELARGACMFMQQCAGTDRQYQAIGKYSVDASVFASSFDRFYTGGGLVDLRTIQQKARTAATPDSLHLGVALVLEAWMVGTAADLWGDVPYSEAADPFTHPTPHYDNQLSVYAALQSVLDNAIIALNGSTGVGPGSNDLVYGGNKAKWRQLAHMLKARFYLHMAEAGGAANYASALAEANQGISTSANDYKTYQSVATTEGNFWYQFQIVQRDSYLRMGKRLVDLMVARNDPRVDAYFDKTASVAWAAAKKYAVGARILDSNNNVEQVTAVTLDSLSGATQPAWATIVGATTTDNHVMWTNKGVPWGGADPGQQLDPATMSNLAGCGADGAAGTRCGPDFRQPLATHAENQLIIAEAAYRTADETRARDSLNAERVAAGLPVVPLTVTGAALLDSIMTEKYVVTFQSIEAWSDYKRTCNPALVPASGTAVIGRLPYSINEVNTNPNVPSPEPARNANDPNACP